MSKKNLQKSQKKYTTHTPEDMASDLAKEMSDNDLLDMNCLLDEDDVDH